MTEDDLKSRCLSKAFEELDRGQLNDLSLRAIARDLNVSHQAPYRHFKSKDSLIQIMSVECFKQFSEALNNREKGADEWGNLRSMGLTYVKFALNFPHRYRLMFDQNFAINCISGETLRQAQYAFKLLRDQLALIKRSNLSGEHLDPQADAFYIWSCLHGLVSLLENPLTDQMPVRENVLKDMVEHVLMRIGNGIRTVS
jgi:AcrR family transcriptional regulator